MEKKKIEILEKMLNNVLLREYHYICKIVVTPPGNYNKQYSVTISFKEMGHMAPSGYFRLREEIMNQAWKLCYDFMGVTVALYQKIGC